jgi:hypothetical protein
VREVPASLRWYAEIATAYAAADAATRVLVDGALDSFKAGLIPSSTLVERLRRLLHIDLPAA